VKRILFPFALLAGLLVVRGAASAQLVLGQYEDEAPLGTWNIFGAPSAPSLGLGGAQFARAWDPSVSFSNPALLLGLPRVSASVSASLAASSLFRYSLVNTGVVSSPGNLTAGVVGVDEGGLAVHSGDWAFALAVAAPESYGRPAIVIRDGGYQLTFEQTGYLRVWHAAIARRLPAGFSVGVGLNYVTGRLDRTTVEQTADILRVVTITDDKSESFKGFYLNGGLTWQATARLTAALAVRSPYVKNGTGRSLLRYEVPVQGTDIRVEAEAVNSYRQPWVFGAGVSFRITEAWSLAGDAAYFGWSRYAVTFFDEPQARPFRDVVKAGAGVEYRAPATISRRPARIPFRLGVLVDPQPMTTVRSAYLALTFGTGLELETVAIDLGASYGRESGSGQALKSGRVVLSVRYIFQE
jgi:long-subunit fatty acid transport protein